MKTINYIEVIRERYQKLGYSAYQWFRAAEPPPFVPLNKPLSESRVGLLSTSGAYRLGQCAYHYKDDTSLRLIPSDTPDDLIRFSHITENYLKSPRKDPNCILPLSQLRQLTANGTIGSVAEEAVTCMGGIYSQRRVREELAPAMLDAYRAQNIDAAFLIPM